MSLKNKKVGKLSYWLLRLPDNTFAECPGCGETKGIPEFWIANQYRMGKNCAACTASGVKKGSKYQQYINSPQWKSKRLEYWRSKKMRECYVCADLWTDFKGKHLHHRTYERLGDEDLDDIVPVCPGCHDRITEAWNEEKLLPVGQRRTLWEVTDEVASQYQEEQYMSSLGMP